MFSLPLALLTLALPPASHDWPQFRGPDRNGASAETGLLKEWPKNGPAKVWTTSDRGGGYSSVSIANGLIFGAGRKGGKEYLWALDEKTGVQKWATPFADGQDVGYGEGTRSTPTFANGKVYVVSINGTLACLNAATGKLVWSKSYTKDFDGDIQAWGYSESVLVDDGKVIGTPCSSKAAMVAFKADTGEVVWQAKVEKAGSAGGYASPIKAEIGGVPMYITLLGNSGGVVGVHAKTGKVLWQYTRMMNGTANIPSPVVKDDLVFASTGYGAGAALLKLSADGANAVTVKEVKFHNGGSLQNHHGGMVVVGDHIYLGDQHNSGHPACVEFATGAVKWKELQGAGGGKGSGTVIAADGRLYFRYENGVVALIKADPSGFELISSFKIPDASRKPSWPHLALANGKLYVRDQEKLHCFNVKAK